jgi:hypothetical protein
MVNFSEIYLNMFTLTSRCYFYITLQVSRANSLQQIGELESKNEG